MRLSGKAAVITGASTGIGRASALRFGEEGARLILVDIEESDIAREVERRGGTARFVEGDVSRRDDTERALAEWRDRIRYVRKAGGGWRVERLAP